MTNILLPHLKQLLAKEKAIRNGRLNLIRGNRNIASMYSANNGFIRHLPTPSNNVLPINVRKFPVCIAFTLSIMIEFSSLSKYEYMTHVNTY